jgi:hypothetical protein
MPPVAHFDAASLDKLLDRQSGVISRQQARGCQLTESAIKHRIRPGGPWQSLLPGIYLTKQGSASQRQRTVAAWLYAERALAVTGPAALSWYSLPAPRSEAVDLLVPLNCQRRDAQFARLHRTSVPAECVRQGIVGYASPARAIADTVRQLGDFSDVRATVAGGVQRGKVTIVDLSRELDRGPMRGSANLRAALAEVADGIRSAAEGDLRSLIKRHHVPEPVYNARLYVDGDLLAITDAYWQEVGLAAEVDSREWHLSPADWEQTLARSARLTAHGILVLHLPPSRIRKAGREVAAQIQAGLDAGRGRPLPRIEMRPS